MFLINQLKRRSLSPLITTILLIIVTFALIGIVLTWGKSFTIGSLNNTSDNIAKYYPSDAAMFITIDKGLNGRFIIHYNPPTSTGLGDLNIVGYSLNSYPQVPLEPPITISPNNSQALDLGIVNTNKFNIILYLSDNTIITKNDITTTNQSPTTCPEGFIPVPGSFLYNTTNGSRMGFCVSKYEMKVDQNGDGLGDSNSSCNTGYQTWDNRSSGCAYNYGSNKLVSTAQGYPLVYISQTEAKAACESLGPGYHLITNEERMTIARNLEQVSSNWSTGKVGSGYLFSGHNDGHPYNALAASTNDLNSYYLTEQSTGSQRRTYQLTNGQTLWDFSGNVWEWADKTINAEDEPYGETRPPPSYQLLEYTDIVHNGVFSYKDFRSLNNTWNSSQGLGKIYTDAGDTGLRGLLFGGDWYFRPNAGPLALLLDGSPSSRTNSLGLRCVQ